MANFGSNDIKELLKLIDSRVESNQRSYEGRPVDTNFANYSNLDLIRQDISEHEKYPAHGIKEMILDVINEQMLENGGLEEVETVGSNDVPLDWNLYPINLGGTGTSVKKDTSVKKYGNQSLRFDLINSYNEEKIVGISQDVGLDKLKIGSIHNVSYFYSDDGLDGYEHFLTVAYFDSENKYIKGDSFAPEKTEGNIGFTRFSANIELPENVYKIKIIIGVKLEPNCINRNIWIDYPMLNAGSMALSPPELTAGIISAKFIKADEAIIDKLFAGRIDTNKLKIISQDGTMILEGNQLKIKSGQEENAIDIITIGRFSDVNEYGFLINDLNGNIKLKATPDKFELKGVELDIDSYVVNTDGTKTYLSQVKQNAESISQKVDQATFNELENTVEGHSSEIQQTANKIAQTVQSVSTSGAMCTLANDCNGTYTQLNVTPILVELNEGDNLYIIDKSTGIGYNLEVASKSNANTSIINVIQVELVASQGSGVHLADEVYTSKITQTAHEIRSEVAERIDGTDGIQSQIAQHADEIELSVKIESTEGIANPKIKIMGQEGGYILLDAKDVIATGTITSEHIDTLGLDAEVIKAGILQSKDGTSFLFDLETGHLIAKNVDLEGIVKANEGSIGGFTIGQNKITSDKVEIDSALSSITLSYDENYKTFLTPDGIYSILPFAQASSSYYTPEGFSESYYIENVRIIYNGTEYKDGQGFSASSKGEIVRYRTSNLPINQDIQITYTVVDGRVENIVNRTTITETIRFTPTTRNSAIITEDSVLDAEFVKNLIVGYTQIGYGSITNAHIMNLSANKIESGIIDVSKGIIIKAGDNSNWVKFDTQGISTSYGVELSPTGIEMPSSMVIKFGAEKKTLEETLNDTKEESLRYTQSLTINNQDTHLFHFDENLTSTSGIYPLSYSYINLELGKFNNSLHIMPSGKISYSIASPTSNSIFAYIKSQPSLDNSKNLIMDIGGMKLSWTSGGNLKLEHETKFVQTSKSYINLDWFSVLIINSNYETKLMIFNLGEYETITLTRSGCLGEVVEIGQFLEMWIDELRIDLIPATVDEGVTWHKLDKPFIDPSPITAVPLPVLGEINFVEDGSEQDTEYVYVTHQQIIEV